MSDLETWLLGMGLGQLARRAVPMQLAQVMCGPGEKSFVFARGDAAPGHHGEFLAGLQLPELIQEGRVLLAITPTGPPSGWTCWGLD